MSRRVALLGFSLAFLSTLAVLAAAAELQLGPISIMDWLYSVSAKLGHRAPVKPGMDWDYVLQGNGGGKAIAAEGFGLAYSVNVTLQELTGRLRVEIKPSSYGGSPQVIGVYAGKWYVAEVKDTTEDGAAYTELTLPPGDYSISITKVALGHSSIGYSETTTKNYNTGCPKLGAVPAFRRLGETTTKNYNYMFKTAPVDIVRRNNNKELQPG